MDRLSFVVVLVAALFSSACGEEKKRARGSRDRVNAVRAQHTEAANPEAMCDVFYPADKAPAFAWPKLAVAAPADAKTGWRWVNVWATWCKPCVEELPRLLKWRDARKKRGASVDLQLVSADETDEEIADFRKSHAWLPAGVRMADAEDLPGCGVPGATLPVHVFVDPSGRVRCVRASAVEETDLPAIEKLLADG